MATRGFQVVDGDLVRITEVGLCAEPFICAVRCHLTGTFVQWDQSFGQRAILLEEFLSTYEPAQQGKKQGDKARLESGHGKNSDNMIIV